MKLFSLKLLNLKCHKGLEQSGIKNFYVSMCLGIESAGIYNKDFFESRLINIAERR